MELGKTIDSKFEHSARAQKPIISTDLGIDTVRSVLQPLKASDPIELTA